MKVEQKFWSPSQGWKTIYGSVEPHKAQLILYFGDRQALPGLYPLIADQYPNAQILGSSTGGEIASSEVYDGTATLAAIQFNDTAIRTHSVPVQDLTQSFQCGAQIGQFLNQPDLKSLFILSDGLRVNGSELVKGIQSQVGPDILITGGLSGDGPYFKETSVGLNGPPQTGIIVGLGIYGDNLRIGHGSFGGWDTFGPERIITRAEGNILYELDHKPALSLYKEYLGEQANQLPSSALLFPLSIRPANTESGMLVRTILGIDEDKQAMIFAGDVPQGQIAQLMRGNIERLVAGASQAAEQAMLSPTQGDSLAILVSCIGRKLLMGQRSTYEVEAVRQVLGDTVPMIGFYSYGEISPHYETGACGLHNQTMTITTFAEN